jgi:hypothetical protein
MMKAPTSAERGKLLVGAVFIGAWRGWFAVPGTTGTPGAFVAAPLANNDRAGGRMDRSIAITVRP